MTTAIPAALAIGGGAMGATGAASQNRAIESTMQRQAQQTRAGQRQIAQQAATERSQQLARARAIQGRLRVAAGEAGVGMGGSMAALSQQAAMDTSRNIQTVDRNAANQQQALRMSHLNRIGQLQASAQDPILAGFTGALQGLTTGLQIGDFASTINFGGNAAAAGAGTIGGPGQAATPSFGGSRFT